MKRIGKERKDREARLQDISFVVPEEMRGGGICLKRFSSESQTCLEEWDSVPQEKPSEHRGKVAIHQPESHIAEQDRQQTS